MSRNIFRQFDNFLEGNKCRGDFLKSFAQILTKKLKIIKILLSTRKNSSYVSGLSVCISVALCVQKKIS